MEAHSWHFLDTLWFMTKFSLQLLYVMNCKTRFRHIICWILNSNWTGQKYISPAWVGATTMRYIYFYFNSMSVCVNIWFLSLYFVGLGFVSSLSFFWVSHSFIYFVIFCIYRSSDDGTCRIWDARHLQSTPRIYAPKPSDVIAGLEMLLSFVVIIKSLLGGKN